MSVFCMSLVTCLRTNTTITDMGKLTGGFLTSFALERLKFLQISFRAAVWEANPAKLVVGLLLEREVLNSTAQLGI